ncbi:ABC transporter permease [Brevundimonas sp. BAL3]|uniref:ABC transporter permease n=1 Tax=Brevundimonas sp. BAL3 TaxID=391600 RepID=UPI0003101799|nr:ABC transporter permease [Brevundimonas sp. BAL3]
MLRSIASPTSRQGKIIGALMMREIMTRYGREGLGFFWLVGEPLLFCFGVLLMWTILKPPYEHGIRLGPFVMTGYMSLLLLRHFLAACMGAVQANAGLLYHRKISILHIYLSRMVLEFAGGTAAFFIVYAALLSLGQVGLPHDYLLLYSGWTLMAWLAMGLGMIFSGLALRYELFERLVGFLSYALIPISGSFVMASFLPAGARGLYLLIPFPHAVEMIRAAVFGEFVDTYYTPAYALVWGLILNLTGLLLISSAKQHLEID